ncbi:MAG: hypothetical protein AAFW73_26370, partial [Bacteroidota bacterium]
TDEIRIDSTCANLYRLVRTWRAADDCGNETVGRQTLIVQDTEGPILSTIPADVTVECSAVPAMSTVTAEDACDGPVAVTTDEIRIDSTCVNLYRLVRTWRAVDDCGNETVGRQTIIVQDTEGPTLSTIPADVTVECSAVPAMGTVTAEDACDGAVAVTTDEIRIDSTCANLYRLVRTWRAVDDCGNETLGRQTIIVQDTEGPILSGIPADVTVECDAVPPLATVTAEDVCDGSLNVTPDEMRFDSTCTNLYRLVRTWRAVDACGNETVGRQTIIVQDTEAPVFDNIPADLTVDLGNGEQIPPVPTDVTANDNCDTPSFTVEEEQVGSGCTYTIIRTWTATDDCGNETVVVQNISVVDGLEVSINPANAQVCNGETLTLTASPNDASYTYVWTSSVGSFDDPNLANPTLFTTTPGTYTITLQITKPDGCTGTASTTVTVGELDGNAFANGPVCEGQVIRLAATGGATYSWTGPNGFTSAEANPVIPNASSTNAGTYTVLIQLGDCAISKSVTVAVQAAPSLTLIGDTEVCEGETLQLNAIGGSNYLWRGPNNFNASGSSISISDIQPNQSGTYYLTAYSTAGCEANLIFEVTIKPKDGNASSNDPVCAGQDLQLSAENGLSYQWRGPNGFTFVGQNPVVSNVTTDAAGMYYVLIFNGDCTFEDSTAVQVIENPVSSAGSNGPICETNTIELFAEGGMTYEWTGPNGFSSNLQNPSIADALPIMSGTYEVVITFGSGCAETQSVDVLVSRQLRVDFSAFDASCNSLGAIIVGVTGGSGEYTFDWEDLAGNNDPRNRSGLEEGTYNLTISDTYGCDFELTGIAIENTCEDSSCLVTPGTLVSPEDSLCLTAGSANLTATVVDPGTVPAGFTQLFLLVDQSTNTIIATGSDPNFVVNAGGQYAIHLFTFDPNTFDLNWIIPGATTLPDLNARLLQGAGDICAALDLSGAGIYVHDIPQVSVEVSPDNCNLTTGTIRLSPDDYQYQWQDGSSGAERSNLVAGNYTVTATDANGCTTSLDVVVRDTCECIPPTLTIVIDEPECGQGTGAITILVDGELSDYTYTWSTNANTGVPNTLGNARSGLNPGIYQVTVTFPLVPNCTSEETVVIGITDGPEITDTIITPASCSNADGTVTFLPEGFRYIWSHDNVTNNIRTGLTAGVYEVIVIDPNKPNCPDIISVEVGAFNPLDVQVQVNAEPSCSESNGSVSLLVNGPGGEYSFNWSDGLSTSNAVRDDLAAGTYQVTISDSGAPPCDTVVAFTLAGTIAEATLSLDPIIQLDCADGTNATLAPQITYGPGFVGPADLVVTDADGLTYGTSGLGQGSYCLQVYDAQGCLAAEACFEVQAPDPILAIIDVTAATCVPDGTIELLVSGGTGAYTFDWSDLPGSNDSEDRSNLAAGTYNLTITDANGCEAVWSDIVVGVECTVTCEPPVISSLVTSDASCGEDNGTITFTLADNPDNYDYTWTPAVSDTTFATDLAAGTYEINIAVLGDASCDTTLQVTISNHDGPAITVVSTSPATCTAADGSVELSPAILIYTWSDGGTGAVRNDLLAGTYTVTATDGICENYLQIDIEAASDLVATAQVLQNPDCATNNGSAIINVTNGSGDYRYSWGAAQIDTLTAGTYTVTVTDVQTGCEAETTFSLTDNVPQATVTITNSPRVSCKGANDAEVTYTI